jgi:hypothetical protein
VFKQSGDEYECARYGLSTVIHNKVCSLLDQKESRR